MSHSATQISTIQADFGRSSSLPASITDTASVHHSSIPADTHDYHQSTTNGSSLQSLGDHQRLQSADPGQLGMPLLPQNIRLSTFVNAAGCPKNDQLSVEEKVEVNTRNNQEACDHKPPKAEHSTSQMMLTNHLAPSGSTNTVVNHNEKTCSFHAGKHFDSA